MVELADSAHDRGQLLGVEKEGLRKRLEVLQAQIKHCKAALAQHNQAFNLTTADPPIDPQLVRDHIATLERREEILGSGLFSDPAWELMLRVFAAALANERLTVTAICARGRLPQSTASRWLKRLEAEGLIERDTDPFDARLSWIHPTPKALEGLVRYFTLRSSAFEASDIESMISVN